MRRLFFPDPPRRLPGRRGLKIALRAIHALCAARLVGASAFAEVPAAVLDAWHWTLASGAALLLLDLHESAAFVAQVRGLLVVAKVSLVIAVPWLEETRTVILSALFILSVLSSHAPASVRYRVVLGSGSVRGSTSKG